MDLLRVYCKSLKNPVVYSYNEDLGNHYLNNQQFLNPLKISSRKKNAGRVINGSSAEDPVFQIRVSLLPQIEILALSFPVLGRQRRAQNLEHWLERCTFDTFQGICLLLKLAGIKHCFHFLNDCNQGRESIKF